MTHEIELQKGIREAVNAADFVIQDTSDGSTEETNWLTIQVALKMVEKAMFPIQAALLKRQVEEWGGEISD